VTAAVAGLGAYILFATNAGGQALAWLGERFDELKSFALTAFQGIKDALAAGDISLAAKILWLSLQVAWRTGIATLKGWWLEFKGWFLKVTDDIFYGAVAMIADAWFGLRKIWLTTVNYWTDILNKFAAFFVRTWNDLNGWVAKQWTNVLAVIDPTINVESVNKRIDQDTQRRNEDVSKQTLDVRLQHERELADLEKNRTQYMVSVAEAADRDDRTRRTQAATETAESESALAQARKEFDDALAEAAKKRADLTGKPTGVETPGAPPADWTDRFAGAEEATQAAAKRVGEFRQIDLSRISLEALGQGKGEEQRVTDPQLKTTNNLLSTLVKQGTEGRTAVAL
jgi:hypothetical protein